MERESISSVREITQLKQMSKVYYGIIKSETWYNTTMLHLYNKTWYNTTILHFSTNGIIKLGIILQYFIYLQMV
jgi:hypothetical protein